MKRKLTICNLPWTVISKKPDKHLSEDRLWGRSDFHNHLIEINTDRNKEGQGETLIHEILHVIINQSGAYEALVRAGVQNTPDFEEMFVRIISPHLYNVIEQLK